MTNMTPDIMFDSVLMNMQSTSTKQVFQNLAAHVHRLIGTPEDFILDDLLNQEKKISSGTGHGVAIPHMRLPRLTRPLTVFATLKQATDFNANDGEWVDMVCLVLSPDFEGPKHLQRLSQITRFFTDQKLCDKLRQADDVEEIKLIMRQKNAQRLAA